MSSPPITPAAPAPRLTGAKGTLEFPRDQCSRCKRHDTACDQRRLLLRELILMKRPVAQAAPYEKLNSLLGTSDVRKRSLHIRSLHTPSKGDEQWLVPTRTRQMNPKAEVRFGFRLEWA